jgi:hypothetical protein
VEATAATRVISGSRGESAVEQRPARRPTQRSVQRQPVRRSPERYARRPRQRTTVGGVARTIVAILILVLLAAAVAGLVILANGSESGASVEQVVRDKVSDQADGLKILIQDNTE